MPSRPTTALSGQLRVIFSREEKLELLAQFRQAPLRHGMSRRHLHELADLLEVIEMATTAEGCICERETLAAKLGLSVRTLTRRIAQARSEPYAVLRVEALNRRGWRDVNRYLPQYERVKSIGQTPSVTDADQPPAIPRAVGTSCPGGRAILSRRPGQNGPTSKKNGISQREYHYHSSENVNLPTKYHVGTNPWGKEFDAEDLCDPAQVQELFEIARRRFGIIQANRWKFFSVAYSLGRRAAAGEAIGCVGACFTRIVKRRLWEQATPADRAWAEAAMREAQDSSREAIAAELRRRIDSKHGLTHVQPREG